MKAFLRADMYRFFTAKTWLIAMLCVALVFVVSVADILSPELYALSAADRPSIIDNFQMNMTFDRYSSLLVLAAALPCVPGLAHDQNNHFFRYLLHRGDLKSYVRARVLVNAVQVLLAMVLGVLLAAAALLPWMTLQAKGNYHTDAFAALATGKLAWGYLVLMGGNFALAILPICHIGMLVSVLQPNRFVALGSTFFAFYLLYSLTNLLPVEFSYLRLACQPLGGVGSLWQLFVFAVMFFLTERFLYLILKRRTNEGIY